MGIKYVFLILFALSFSFCGDANAQIGKSRLTGNNYRLFQGTPAWDLAKATQDQDIGLMKRIISRKKDLVNYKDPGFGQTLLSIAVGTEKYKSADILLQSKADPNSRDKLTGKTPLMLAASIGTGYAGADIRYINLLLKYGADPNLAERKIREPNITLLTPLLIACAHGTLSYVKILIGAGANINYRSSDGENVLDCAITWGNYDLVMYLIQKGADYKKPIVTYNYNEHVYILRFLKSKRVVSGSEDEKKRNSIIKYLTDHGVTK